MKLSMSEKYRPFRLGVGELKEPWWFFFQGKPRSKAKKYAVRRLKRIRKNWIRLLGEHDRFTWIYEELYKVRVAS